MSRSLRYLALALLAVLGAARLNAAERDKAIKYGEYNPADESVDMFDAIKAGKVAVKMIPKDSTQARVLVTNKTKQPLNVRLPGAFAGVQILAQVGGRAGGMGGMGGGMAQPMGGGMGGMGGGGMGGMGGGAGGGGGMFAIPAERMGEFFNVPAEKMVDFKVPCVCLEHGKPEPRSTMTYEIRPLETVSDKPAVREVCEMLGRGLLNQRAAQAAMWHLNNNLSWEELAAKQIERADGSSYPYFTSAEMTQAVAVADQAIKLAAERKPAETTPPTPTTTSTSAADPK
jgi:hypothetical protein